MIERPELVSFGLSAKPPVTGETKHLCFGCDAPAQGALAGRSKPVRKQPKQKLHAGILALLALVAIITPGIFGQVNQRPFALLPHVHGGNSPHDWCAFAYDTYTIQPNGDYCYFVSERQWDGYQEAYGFIIGTDDLRPFADTRGGKKWLLDFESD